MQFFTFLPLLPLLSLAQLTIGHHYPAGPSLDIRFNLDRLTPIQEPSGYETFKTELLYSPLNHLSARSAPNGDIPKNYTQSGGAIICTPLDIDFITTETEDPSGLGPPIESISVVGDVAAANVSHAWMAINMIRDRPNRDRCCQYKPFGKHCTSLAIAGSAKLELCGSWGWCYWCYETIMVFDYMLRNCQVGGYVGARFENNGLDLWVSYAE